MSRIIKTRIFKRVLGAAFSAAFLTAGVLASASVSAYADENAVLPSVTAFATPGELGNPNNFTLHPDNGSGVAQKVHFGTNSSWNFWYIAGKNADGTLVLMCDPQYPVPINEVYWGIRFNESELNNLYKESSLRAHLIDDALGIFSNAEKGLMADSSIWTEGDYSGGESPYLLNDKLYAACAKYNDDYIYVGNNSEEDLYSGLKISLSGEPYQTSEFWLRSPDSGNDYALCVWPTSDCVDNKLVNECTEVVPAFHLNLSSVLFASKANPATDSSSFDDEAMTFRIKGSEKISSTAKVDGQTISVNYAEGDGDVYLYVQGRNSDDWVVSKKVTETPVYLAENIRTDADLSKCQVWLEKKDTDANLTYAVYAEGGNHKGNSGNDGPDDNNSRNSSDLSYSCNHDFVWQTITLPTQTEYGTEGYVCSMCGETKDVRAKSPLDDWARMKIDNARPGDVLTIDFGPWNSFPLWMMQKIADKPTVTYIFKYTYQGYKYEVTIKAGDEIALDCDWFGPAKMAEIYDSVITKW